RAELSNAEAATPLDFLRHADGLFDLGHPVQDIACQREQGLSLCRQLCPIAVTAEELNIQTDLQLGNALGKRGQGNVDEIRRTAEIAAMGGPVESLDLFECHREFPWNWYGKTELVSSF